MSMLMESLESRTFLSATAVTSATLAADQANITADAAIAVAALKTLVADIKANTVAIKADVKSLPASNTALFNTLKVDESRAGATLSASLNLLLKPGGSLAKKSANTGDALLAKATIKNLAVAGAEITALGSVATAPLANLLAAMNAVPVGADLQALVTANPTDVQLVADVATASTNASTQTTALQSAATKFASDIATLTADLSSVKTAVGTFPNMLGTFAGTSLSALGKDGGVPSPLTIIFTSEDSSGNLVGTATTKDNAFTLTGTVTLNGKFAAKFSGSGKSAALVGQVTGATLSGTYKAPQDHDAGTFTTIKAP